MISVKLCGGQCRLELEMDGTVENLMWIRIFCDNSIQFTACRYDWRDWYVERYKLCSPNLVAGCGTFTLNDETDGAVIEAFLEDCKNGCRSPCN